MRTQSVSAVNTYNPNKKKTAKIAGAAVTTAAAAGSVLYMAKKGKLNPTEGGNKIVEKLKAGLKKPADKILSKIEPAISKLKQKNTKTDKTKISRKITNSKTYKAVSGKIEAFKSAHPQPLQELTSKIKHGFYNLSNKIEAKAHPEKFI